MNGAAPHPKPVGWPSARRGWATLAAAALCVACAPLSPPAYRSDRPPTITLPIALAGVKDRRASFAALFWHTLVATRHEHAGEVSDWLHGVTDADLALGVEARRAMAAFAGRAGSTSVLVVPGLFGDCTSAQSVPFGDGVMRSPDLSATEAYRQYADLGLASIRMVPLPGRASSTHNGRLLADALRAEAARAGVQRIVVVAYSKGVADTLHALAQLQAEGDVPPSVVALVSVAGAVMGTPLADGMQAVYEALSPLVTPFDCTPAQPGDLASVTQHVRRDWLARHRLPAQVHYASIVAHAAPQDMAPSLRPLARWLAATGAPNDGQLIAADAMLPGGALLAEARADHWDVALPRNRHPSAFVRGLGSGRDYPREALLRATLTWVVGGLP